MDQVSVKSIYSGPPSITSTIATGLSPSAQYGFVLEAINGGGATNSTPVNVRMPSRTPPYIPVPNVTVLGATSIDIWWNTTEGVDQYGVLMNPGMETEVDRNVGTSTSVEIEGLLPYTEYSVRVRACLIGVNSGCGTGPEVIVRTLEALPREMGAPTLIAVGSSAVQISWSPPKKPNGVIHMYRIHRRLAGITDNGILINTLNGNKHSFVNSGPDLLPFTLYEYKIVVVNSIGETSGPWGKVQTLEASPGPMRNPQIEITDAFTAMVSWIAPTVPNGVITMYKIEYQALLSDLTIQSIIQTVSVHGNVTNSTVSGLTPYTRYQFRLVAVNSAGTSYSDWSAAVTLQAAPSEMNQFTVEKIKTGYSVILRWDPPRVPNGFVENYLVYESGNPNPIYQGLSREFEFRRLQPFMEYSVQLEACTIGGCTKGVMFVFKTAEISPSGQGPPSMVTVGPTVTTIKWQRPSGENGNILKYEVFRKEIGRRSKRAIDDGIVVFNTTNTDKEEFTFTDTSLYPYTIYEYKIRASNSKGHTDSSWLRIETGQSAPTGLEKPKLYYVGNKHDELRITWEEPVRPNGVLQNYKLRRNDSVPWSFTPDEPKEFIDRNLVAFTWYAYSVTACNGGGCSTSEPAYIQTQETSPLVVVEPKVEAISSTELHVSWTVPKITNGQIRTFYLKVDNITKYTGLNLEYRLTGLTPYQLYEFVLSACTNGGCKDSLSVFARPKEDMPQRQLPPSLIVLSSTSIEVTWDPPQSPNGIIIKYELRRNGDLIESRITTRYTDYGLEAGTKYGYTVTAYNAIGHVVSSAAFATTYSSSPVGLAAPVLEAQSSTAIR